jgi:putative membrane protein
VDVNVAGYAAESDQSSSTNLLLPVGSREDALVAVWLVLPDLGTGDPRALLGEALTGAGAGRFFTVPPRQARWLDPIVWRRTGVAVTDRALVIRTGRIVRRVVIVPHERTQSLGVQQGPWQRRLSVATFAVHSTPGPIAPTVAHLASSDAAALMDQQAARARRARAHAGPELWMRRDEVPS